jgi:hypothetical protein
MVMIKKIAAGSALAVSGALMFSAPAFALVTTSQIANNAVTSAKIADYNVMAHDIATGAVGGRAISMGGVQMGNIGRRQVSADKLTNIATDMGAADVTVNLSNSNGSYKTNITTNGSVTAGGLLVNAGTASFGGTTPVHLVSTQGTIPTVAKSMTGVTAVAVAGGTDTRGVITSTGTASAAGTVTLTFNSAYASAPVVVITPANASAVTGAAYVTSSTTNFVITTTVSAAGSPSWNYEVIQ